MLAGGGNGRLETGAYTVFLLLMLPRRAPLLPDAPLPKLSLVACALLTP